MTALLLALLLAADTSPKYVVIEPHRGVANAVPLSTTPGTCADATHALGFNGSTLTCQAITGSSGAPTGATYITQTHDATLSAEQAMADLGTGLVKNTTTTGVQSIYAGSACAANTVARSTDSSGALTCSAVALGSADVSGTLTEARGGTGAGALTCSAGQALTSNGTLYSCTATITASDVVCAGTCIADAEIAAVAGSKVSGAVATATALAADPAGCSAGQYTTDINASGVATCAQVTTAQLSGTITDAQLANNYSGVGACAANTFASTLNDNAAPTCTQVDFTNLSGTATDSQIPNNITINLAATATALAADPADCSSGQYANAIAASGALSCAQVAYSQISGTPTVPTDISGEGYWVKTASANLSSEVAMGALASGLVLNATTTGIPTIYGGTSCSNQFPRSLSAAGAATCAGVGVLDFTANQGTTTTLLHGNAAGQPSWAAVVDGDVSGQIGLSHGGTNANITAAAGAVAFSTSTALGVTAAGASGQVLVSAGTGTPTWGSDLHVLYSNAGADETHSGSTATGVTGLSFTQATSTKYMLDCNLLLTNTATSATRLAISTGNAGDTVNCGFMHVTTSLTAPVFANEPTGRWATTCTNCTTAVTSSVSVTTQYAHLLCSIVTAGTGTTQVFAGASTNGQTNVVKGGSYCTWFAAGL